MVYRNLFLDILNFEVHTGNFISRDVSQSNTGARLKRSAFNYNSILFAFVCTCTPYSTSKQDCSLDTDTTVWHTLIRTYWSIRYWSIGVLAKSRIERRVLGWRGTWTKWSKHTRIPIYQILSRYPHACHLSHKFVCSQIDQPVHSKWIKHAALHSSAGARSEPNGPDVAPGARL